jgi:GTPase
MKFRAGFVGLIGQPNAGKSTLLNALVEEKVSIVTPKPQTTRRRVIGIVNQENGQIVIVDAPGLVSAKKGLNAFLEKEAHDVISSSDALIGVISLDEKNKDQVNHILDLLIQSKKPYAIVITKSDLAEFKHRLQLIKDLVTLKNPKTEIFEFSTKWGKDIKQASEQIINRILPLLPETPQPLYDTEIYTPHTLREVCAEIIREQCFELLDKEIPYFIAIKVKSFDESDPTIAKIQADIIVSKESHKPILIGKNAEMIKQIGIKSRKEIEKLLNSKVFLKLDVVVKDNWSENSKLMKDLGYYVDE